MADVATAVAGTLVDMFGMPNDEPDAQPEAGAPAPEAPEPEAPDDDDLPDDIAALLDEPDLDDPDPDLEVNLEEYQDTEELARELTKTRKRNKYLEEQTLIKARKEWRREGKKYFPYAELDTIEATSRRGFLKQAQTQHEQIKGRVESVLTEERKKLTAAQTAEQVAAREAAATSWGKPVTGGAPAMPPAQTTADDRLQAARRNRDLQGSIRALIDSGAV